jgi:ubiquinol-cytochrome c reductase cytochrome c subunit
VIGAGAAAYDFYLRTGRMPLAAPDEAQWRQEPVLSADAIAALTAYGATLGDGPAIPRVVTEGADLHRGWQLFLQNCASCHGTSGSGGAVGGGNVAPHLFRVDEVLTVEAMILGPGAMPVFLWPEEDLNAVAAYVRYLQQAPSPGGLPLGSVGPVPEGFIAGVLGLGVIVVLLRWIARGEERKRPDAEERAAEGPAA